MSLSSADGGLTGRQGRPDIGRTVFGRPAIRAAAGLVVLLGLMVSACGGDDDRLTGDRLADELVKADIPEDVATCVADELDDGLSRSAIEQRDEAESEKFLTALNSCVASLSPEEPVPDGSVPDLTTPPDSSPDGG